MNFGEALNENLVNLELQAKSKIVAIKELIELLYQEGKVNDRDLFQQNIYEREAEARTGFGNHAVIWYVKSDAVTVTSLAIGRTEHDLVWDSLDDDAPIHIVILFAVSKTDKTELQWRLSGQVTSALAKEQVLKQLLITKDKKEVISLLVGDSIRKRGHRSKF